MKGHRHGAVKIARSMYTLPFLVDFVAWSLGNALGSDGGGAGFAVPLSEVDQITA